MSRVLVIEDNATQAVQLRLILESAGYVVDAVPSGARGLALLAGGGFDLVVSDVVMPEMSGYELCRAIKTAPATRDTPVMLLTSLSDPSDIIQGMEAGADNFLTKPYEPEHLLARIAAILENRRLRADGLLQPGREVLLGGQRMLVTSDRQQILDLLISTVEDFVQKNRELAASKSALEAANKELEAFSYSVSHDLRAPLRAIDGFTALVLEQHAGNIDERGRGYLERVRASASRMSRLIDDLLQFSRVTRAEFRRITVDLSRLATAVIAELRAASPERVVDFHAEGDLVVRGDPSLLRVVLDNLLGNAWKFTATREDARIELGRLAGRDEVIHFVRDNGAGFDMRYAAKLFTPFQRLHGEAEFPGTGIGLATVKRIISRHGGRAWAEASPGKGATFYFTLPPG